MEKFFGKLRSKNRNKKDKVNFSPSKIYYVHYYKKYILEEIFDMLF